MRTVGLDKRASALGFRSALPFPPRWPVGPTGCLSAVGFGGFLFGCQWAAQLGPETRDVLCSEEWSVWKALDG